MKNISIVAVNKGPIVAVIGAGKTSLYFKGQNKVIYFFSEDGVTDVVEETLEELLLNSNLRKAVYAGDVVSIEF
jgi:hypothetical protein